MIRNRILLKTFAVFFILEMLGSVVTPAVSWALTAGPTAPEATSFEPVDTTDIVDLKTGDFVYNIPLLEVPGPAGGYPFSLSYHAGIQPEQEASWTGLGFTLNPGSIFRLVNGYADDHNYALNVDRAFYKGGEREEYTVGLSYGFTCGVGQSASVSAGLTFGNDTYKGSGVGWYTGVGFGQTYGAGNVGISATVGMSPWGDPQASIGASVGIGKTMSDVKATANVGFQFNFGSGLSTSAGVGLETVKNHHSLIDASISSNGSDNSTHASLSVGGGMAGVNNSNANHLSVDASSIMVDVPIGYTGFSVRLGRDYQRYWIDETANVYTFGALYGAGAQPSLTTAFDTYDLLDTTVDVVYNYEPEKVLGGSFPDVDMYSVMAQGISGNIRPYAYQQNLYRQDKEGDTDLDTRTNLSKSISLSSTFTPKPMEFRFINDFSNRLEYKPGNFNVGTDKITFDFEGNLITGKEGNDGYNITTNHLAGSKHVEWYTNAEILRANPQVKPFEEGFIDCVADGFTRQSDSQIGGYSITNSSGVTYHFALPAYSYDEYMKSVNSSTKQAADGERWNELKKPTRYAYTWFLTAITGPDYVDTNDNGLADHNDWGYWVNFEYKKWANDYRWRNPGEGTNRDLDGDFENFAAGKKEVYYLDKIITQSHVAIFEKSERIDGREVTDLYAGGFETKPIYTPNPDYVQCINACNINNNCSGQACEFQLKNCITACKQTYEENVISGYLYARSSLKLDRIKLFNYTDYIKEHIGRDYVIREIDFGYDDGTGNEYSLAPGTPNSYDSATPTIKQGKLTLKTLTFLGKKAGEPLIPPIRFNYKNAPYEKSNDEVKADVWGYYKSDFTAEYRDSTNEIIGKLTTDESAQDVDVWSLNQITTSLGSSINIEYECDQYNNVVLENQQILRTKTVTDYAQDRLKITFWEKVDLSKFLKIGLEIGLDLVGTFKTNNSSSWAVVPSGNSPEICGDIPAVGSSVDRNICISGTGIVEEININDGYIIVNSPTYYNKLKYEKKTAVSGSYKQLADGRKCNWYTTLTWENSKGYPAYIPAGIISFPRLGSSPGGGLRVKSISIGNPARKTSYFYENGTTSYEPYQIAEPKIGQAYKDIYGESISAKFEYKKAVLKHFSSQLNISRQVPGPGVMYQKVTVRESNEVTPDNPDGILLPNYSVYEFETYKRDMVGLEYTPVLKPTINGEIDDVDYDGAFHRKIMLKDFSSRVGNLKGITLFDGNNQISKTTNNYLHDSIPDYENELSSKFLNQGLVDESFVRARLVYYKYNERRPYANDEFLAPPKRNLLATLSTIETFPVIQTGQTNINYKTGIQNQSYNLAFDFYSGEATQVLTTDSYGNRYLSVSVPAYKNYSGMGLKIDNKSNRNMLSQIAEEYSYVVNASNAPIGVLSASIQTWSDKVSVLNLSVPQTNIWRMHANYQWNGQQALLNDGSYPYDNGTEPTQNFDRHAFTNWYGSAENEFWQKTGELTLYDIYSHGLEAKDINENYAATRMNIDQSKVLASASNAKYNEISNSSAEYYIGSTEKDGGVSRGEGDPSTAHTHTGHYSLLVGANKQGFNYTLTNNGADLTKKFRASVWVYLPGQAETQPELDKLKLFYTIKGQEKSISPTLQKSKSKSWYLLNLDIVPNGTNEIFIGVHNGTLRGAYFDDFRVHPLNSSLASYVYDPFSGELNFILDANNFYTRFEYDAMGRLLRTTRELLNFDFGDNKESYRADIILKEMKYNYGKGN